MLFFIIILSCVIFTGLYAEPQQVDAILAKVGREIILFSDLVKQINQMRSARMWDDEMTPDLVLTDMIENKLIVQKARELNIRVDERRVRNTAENHINQIRSQFPTVRDFHRELRNAGLVLSDLRKYYEDMLTEQFLRDRLIQSEIRSRINITDSDIFNYFTANQDNMPTKDESYELAMILRVPSPSPETERRARNKINDVKNRIQRGEDFRRLAREFSECPSAQANGDLGYFTRGMMVKEFEDVAFRTGINEISDIVKTRFGYHIIMVTDKTGDEVQASHILVKVDESPDDIIREKVLIESLHSRLLNGEDFAELAVQYSDDEDSQKRNGVLGTLTVSEFPSFFAQNLTNLVVGEISEVLEYQNMFYIFRINEEFEPRTYSFDEIKDLLKDRLFQQRQFELYEQWIESLKREMFVQVYLDRLINQN
jgi:peptidyl-prolyl cis-trans isomerase SurA